MAKSRLPDINRARRFKGGCLLKPTIILILLLSASAAAQQTNQGIILGPDTTVFTGPLRADGTVDYVAALNAKNSHGITAENNAAALLMRITNPDVTRPGSLQRRRKILDLLGVQINAGEQIAWQPWHGFTHPLPTDDPNNPGYVDRFGRAEAHPWSAADDPDLAAWLKSNEKALDIVLEASRLPHYWVPLVRSSDDPPGIMSTYLTDDTRLLRAWTNALEIRSMLRLHDGDTAGGLNDLLALYRLSSLVTNTPLPEPLTVAVGGAISPVWTTWRFLQENKTPPDQLRRWATDMLAIAPPPIPPIASAEFCRFDLLAMVQGLTSTTNSLMPPGMGTAFWDWNQMLRFDNQFFDSLEKNGLSLPDRVAALNKLTADLDWTAAGGSRTWLMPRAGETRRTYTDRVSAALLLAKLPAFGGISGSLRRQSEHLNWTASVGVALAIYHHDTGKYPATLNALVPQYLPKLPQNTSQRPVAYDLHGPGYIIRLLQHYSPATTQQLARYHMDYDNADIIMRTDQQP